MTLNDGKNKPLWESHTNPPAVSETSSLQWRIIIQIHLLLCLPPDYISHSYLTVCPVSNQNKIKINNILPKWKQVKRHTWPSQQIVLDVSSPQIMQSNCSTACGCFLAKIQASFYLTLQWKFRNKRKAVSKNKYQAILWRYFQMPILLN